MAAGAPRAQEIPGPAPAKLSPLRQGEAAALEQKLGILRDHGAT
jgi:hypothetical protein